ncbi:hypothetical protein CDAR_541071 [Caerostris darwini]|uniref:Uncharacterized protein n=1 Tax=Caerostris darwini TaxID=1538125 RepID=A0AAV4UR06_9ARAC|nr:hypothetical protein CDAR_541071 [Caerostris darwini]
MLKFNRVLADQTYEEMAISHARNCPVSNRSRMSRVGRNGVCVVDGERIYFGDVILVKKEGGVVGRARFRNQNRSRSHSASSTDSFGSTHSSCGLKMTISPHGAIKWSDKSVTSYYGQSDPSAQSLRQVYARDQSSSGE